MSKVIEHEKINHFQLRINILCIKKGSGVERSIWYTWSEGDIKISKTCDRVFIQFAVVIH